jgi:hypothetical protein
MGKPIHRNTTSQTNYLNSQEINRRLRDHIQLIFSRRRARLPHMQLRRTADPSWGPASRCALRELRQVAPCNDMLRHGFHVLKRQTDSVSAGRGEIALQRADCPQLARWP